MPASVSLDGLQADFRARVEALLADPEARALGVYVVSAYRDPALQRRLWEEALAKYGSAHLAAQWVARPGTSDHERGLAVDLGVAGFVAVSGQWPSAIEAKVNTITARHGLYSPLSWEDWHYLPDPYWHPPEDEMEYVDVQVEVDKSTGHGWAVVPGVGLDRCPVPVYLSGDDGVVAKVGLSRNQAPAGAVVTVDMGGPIYAPITVTVRVAHNR